MKPKPLNATQIDALAQRLSETPVVNRPGFTGG